MRSNYVPELGKLATEKDHRDAVHIAVAPVVSAEWLNPGEHVGLRADGKAVNGVEPIGAVDPFLSHKVMPGERFWLFLFPNTITSLRHVWSHPAFATKVPEVR